MIVAVLLGVLALIVGGCACVVWAERGGPRWARVVATVTLTASELLRASGKKRRRGLNPGSQGDE
jgi:predicted anti-sigma-YlaC factor YlaD